MLVRPPGNSHRMTALLQVSSHMKIYRSASEVNSINIAMNFQLKTAYVCLLIVGALTYRKAKLKFGGK